MLVLGLGQSGDTPAALPCILLGSRCCFLPTCFPCTGEGREGSGASSSPWAQGKAGENMEVSCWHAGCWGEDGAEHTSSESRAHTTRITPANPVTDLTYIWGRGGDMSAAADGVLKSLGSGRLRSCWPLALMRERMGCPLAEQPLQVESFLRLSGMVGILLT